MIDLANAFHKNNHQVSLVTGRLVVRNKPLASEIKLLKICRYNRRNTFMRLLTWSFGSLQMLLLIWFKLKKQKLIIVSNPPFAPLLPLLFKNPFYLLIFDIYPDALIEKQLFSSNSNFIKAWQKLNRKVFMRADRIITLTEGMRNLLGNYVDINNVEVINIWSNNDYLKPIDPSTNPFIIKNKLLNKFIVLYSGNLGFTGHIEKLVDVAFALKEHHNILFLIIGEGPKAREIEYSAKKLQLNNLKLLPLQPVSDIPWSLASADIAVVTLGKNFSKLAIPSKFYDYLSVAAPILCLGSKNSELEEVISSNRCGACFEPENIDEISSYILRLYNNNIELKDLSEKALLTSKKFSIDNIKLFFDQNTNH